MASSDESEEASSINESEDAPGEEEDAGEEDDEDEQAEQGRSSDSAGRLRGANDRDAMREMREQRAHKMLGGMFKKQEDPNEKESPKKKAAFSEKHRYRCANWAVPDSAAAKEAPTEWTRPEAEKFLKTFLMTGRESQLDYAAKQQLEKKIEWLTRNTTVDLRPACTTALTKTDTTNSAAATLASLGFQSRKDWCASARCGTCGAKRAHAGGEGGDMGSGKRAPSACAAPFRLSLIPRCAGAQGQG